MKVIDYIHQLNKQKVLHFSLIDPDKIDDIDNLNKIAKKLFEAGTSAFLIGGTLGVSKDKLDEILEILGDYKLPRIIFPSNVNLISEKADAILFLSLLNSDDPYYVIGAQVVAAPIIKKIHIEPISTGYLIVGYGGTAGHIGRARVIPFDNYDLAVSYALAAEYIGMKFLYLEAGSGSPEAINPEMIRRIKKYSNIGLIVGGGIRDIKTAEEIAKAGANIIVTGNIIEDDLGKAIKIIDTINKIKVE
ncbi:geranylgeranylglyceryl/heptaprenylglyceryl phosphate synthase [Acidianus sulfidivorans JP7]|uniref:Geranylgeranylglyceryl phosphate synthase n=1 Tax=Acidianus sulfidivorans JP7 TaxID=619593 RepID=A0A2U9IMI7_9CREN|nr:geranylgeranylglyceryl/heptaprenylglyceryl phosphate synthase [Acidianus sulfidivorans]AWR97232.1 geranylgeranylglyceryl/heptaprenylglyceryl phosphate synthase [Acidianus sulfidivorans JP7]